MMAGIRENLGVIGEAVGDVARAATPAIRPSRRPLEQYAARLT